ncbi:hypothetical protein [Amycolatopsis benzoatilytica]|uniref:hypothetical protein n=1 Tax=Amycolatopsis benzoatilytica TaxID=346045 RepID=UPI00037380B2|nr:hypothetical protein [Amycolatopsis benzoatilytica]
MIDSSVSAEPTAEARARAARAVQRSALDEQDEAELMAMLGLDQDERPALPQRRGGALSATELVDLLTPFAEERLSAAGSRTGPGA